MNIDKQFIKDLHPEINAALAEVGKKHNLKITLGRATYSNTNIVFKLNCDAIVDGSVVTKEEENFKAYAKSYGLEPTDLGQTFTDLIHKKVWKIVGLNPRSHKFPILCADRNGKVYKLGVQAVRLGLRCPNLSK